MTTNKPEVVAHVEVLRGHGGRFVTLRGDINQNSLNDGDALIRLSDYEALLARVEELEKTMAAIRSASGYRWMNGISDHKLLSDIEKMAENVTQVAELERQYIRGGQP